MHFLRPALAGIAVAILSPVSLARGGIHLAQGILAGEPTEDSVILQARLTAAPGLVDGDVPGAPGTGRFEISRRADFSGSLLTEWLVAAPESDFILKAAARGLEPATDYHWRVIYGPDEESALPGGAARFRTLAGAVPAAAGFVLTSCMNYGFFQEGPRGDGKGAYQGEDKHLGFPALDAVRALAPDFVIFNGDCVYYDHPKATRARSQAELRRKWHEQHVQGRFPSLFAGAATYWLKDDHDHRINDSDRTGDYEPSHELGVATFREQLPVVDPGDESAVTYRTRRVTRDLQLWFVEGRDYRSPNAQPDGPDKTLWGAEQLAWLRRTLAESDATFKILVSPTPLVGPDDAYKKDNHVNREGFRHEGEAFFSWLEEESGIPPGRFFVICGDRHWKYHSIHPSGYEEFCCGALNRENSRLGRDPGEEKSTDPGSLVRQPYADRPPSGGFLHVAARPAADGKAAELEFTLRDDEGEILYRHVAAAPGQP